MFMTGLKTIKNKSLEWKHTDKAEKTAMKAHFLTALTLNRSKPT